MRTPRSWAGLAVVIAAAGIAGAFVACSDFTPPGPAGTSALSVNPKTAHINVGGTLQLTARGAAGGVVWSSSDNQVATVSFGKITGVGSGSATIRAVSGTDQASARITVTRAAAIAVSSNNLTFSGIPAGSLPDSQTVAVTNAGEDSLTALQIAAIGYDSSASGWLTARLTQTNAPATLVVRPSTTALAPGSYTATITISSSVAASPQTVAVRFTLVRPAGIALGSTGATFTVQQGSAAPSQQSIAITNAGDAPLTGLAVGAISYSSGASNWLDASVTPSVAPASLLLRPNTSALTPGDYSAIVPVTSSVAGVAPATVSVTYHVTAAPTPATIVLSKNAVPFSGVIGDPLPNQTSVDVTDGGQQPLTGLTVTTSYTSGQPANWLTVGLGGSSAPTTITLQPNTTGLSAGTYTATIAVASPVAANQSVTLTVSYTLIRPASIVLGSSTATFSAQQTTSLPSQQPIAITNGGDVPLTGLAVGTIGYSSGATGWLSATVSPTTAPASLLLQPNSTSLPVGDYTATVPVTSSVPRVAPETVTVTYHVTAAPTPPVIVLSTSALTFSGTSGSATPSVQQTVNVTDGGQVALTNVSVSTSYTTGSNWLTVTPSGSTAPLSITIQPNTTGLTAGTYTATISVASTVATNTPQTITVTYTLIRPASIVLGASSATFSAQQNATTPAQQSISVTNGGDAPLTGLALGTITYSAGAANWLVASVSPSSAPASLLLQPNTTALAPGDYTATVPVTSSVTGVASQNVTVTYHVTPPPPVIVVNPTSLTFTAGRNFATLPATQQIAVTTSGTGTVSGLSAASITYGAGATGWLTTSFVGGNTTAPTTLNVQPNATGLAAGVYSATIHLSSTTAGVATKDIPVTYVINDLVLSQSSVNDTTTSNTPPTISPISVSNAGSGNINNVSVSVSQGFAWLTASIASTVPQSPNATSLSLTIQRADSLGTFVAQVIVSAPGFVSKTVTVTLTRRATLAGDILPILQSCSSSCHTTGNSTNFFVSFANADTAYRSLVTPNNGQTYVVVGDSTASNLYNILNGNPLPSGYHTMPSSSCTPTNQSACLSAALRTKIYIWIVQGALKQ